MADTEKRKSMDQLNLQCGLQIMPMGFSFSVNLEQFLDVGYFGLPQPTWHQATG